jgi:hypothetical protein
MSLKQILSGIGLFHFMFIFVVYHRFSLYCTLQWFFRSTLYFTLNTWASSDQSLTCYMQRFSDETYFYYILLYILTLQRTVFEPWDIFNWGDLDSPWVGSKVSKVRDSISTAHYLLFSTTYAIFSQGICVTIDGVWIDDWIYWLLIHITRNYK